MLGREQASFPPPRIILNAVEGFGKTTVGAFAPNPAFLMARGETGYTTLLGSKLVPDVDRVVLESYEDTLAMVDHLIANDTGHKSIVFDALGGFERLCHETVCDREFNGEWGEKGFQSYRKGYEITVTDWLKLLARLDRLRETRNTIVIMLCHAQIKNFKNPLGEDFDRYVADVDPKTTWAVTLKWSDVCLFGNFFTVTEKDKRTKRSKGIGGTERIVFTERRDAYDAKNRCGMEPSFYLTDDPSQSWNIIWNAMQPAEGESNAG